MTNFDRWLFYCRDFKSPDIFIEFGWYALVAAALQRRVWRGSIRKPVFPSLYTFLVGDAGVGKGLVIEEVEKILKHNQMRMTEEELRKDMLFGSMHLSKKASDKGKIELPLLVHVGPNSTTFEHMVFEMASNTRSFFYGPPESKKLYIHSSICFCLPEMASLFRKDTHDLVNFLLQTYDCGDYNRSTLGRGDDDIKNCCLNIIAGTTPSFIRRVFSQDLLDQGFSSRSMFIFAKENRFNRVKPPEFNTEQEAAYAELLKHIKNVSLSFGEVKFTDEADAFLEHWGQTVLPYQIMYVHEKQKSFCARIPVTAQKLAMAKHFSESEDMLVTKEDCEWAVEATERISKNMMGCFQGEAKNPLEDVTKEIMRYLKTQTKSGGAGTNALLVEFYKDLPNGRKSLVEIMDYLSGTKQVKVSGDKYQTII